MTTHPIVSAKGVYKKFSSGAATEELQILADLNLQVNKGDTIAIVGSSGSGKSTLLSLLAGLDIPDQGNILIDGKDLTKLDETARSGLRAKKMAFVFQDFMLLPHLTSLENVMLPMEMRGLNNPKELAQQELNKVGLGDRANHFPSQLSGGEQQRTALARAFAAKPLLLFADEPNGNLDSTTSTQIVDLLFKMNRESNTTLILVTHDMLLAEKCNHIYELANGVVTLKMPNQSNSQPSNPSSNQPGNQPSNHEGNEMIDSNA